MVRLFGTNLDGLGNLSDLGEMLGFGSGFGVKVALSGALFVLLGVVYFAVGGRAKNGRQIPGPAGWPIVGNALQMATKDEWLQFDRWAKQYGTFSTNFCPNHLFQLFVWMFANNTPTT